jgi:superfamily II DNA or RNA helicase
MHSFSDLIEPIKAIGHQKKLTRFGYIVPKKSLSEEELNAIKTELTIKPFKHHSFGSFFNRNKGLFYLYLENEDYISLPKYYGLDKLGKADINKLESYPFPTYKMKYEDKLRPIQKEIVKKVIKGLDKHHGGLLIAGCGSGKTNMAIYIACYYHLKTLFLTHKGFLKRQIMDRIISVTNIQKVGVIQQDIADVDHPFVVGMVQSIIKRDYDDAIFRDFGMVIIDEVHHMAAKNFSKFFQKVGSLYMLGISAERTRSDGCYQVINWYMGPFLHYEEQKPNNQVVVKKFQYYTSNQERVADITNPYTKELDRSKMITNLIHIKRRNRFIMKLIEELFDQGKNILCLSGRIKQVHLFYRLLTSNDYLKKHVGKYIGNMTEEELKVSATKQIILGTYHMAQEGLDIENLNVVVLCTPISNIKQSVGRILRKEIYEESPLVIDITDMSNGTFQKQYYQRQKYYVKQQYNIQIFNVSDYQRKKCFSWDDRENITSALEKEIEHSSIIKHHQNQNLSDYDIDKIEFID